MSKTYMPLSFRGSWLRFTKSAGPSTASGIVHLKNDGMRKGTKSSLYRAFAPTGQVDLNDTKYIIDGGFLLHRVK